jgi:translation initiation factor 1
VGGEVYSTRDGRLCPGCGRPVAHCICARLRAARPAGDGRVRVGRETQGRNGKAVTVVTGLPLLSDELRALAKELKQRCGTGGTVKDGVLEIQGDHRDLIVAELARRGFDAKRSGG